MMALAVLQLGIALGAITCARLTQHTRNYYPMQRVVWTAIAFVFGGTAVSTALNTTASPVTRVAFSGAMFAAVLYSQWFIRKRNGTPRYIVLDLGGAERAIAEPDAARALDLVESLASHGKLDPAAMERMGKALAQGRRMRRWREGTKGQR